MVIILRLSLHQLGGRWRLALIFLLAALPIGLSALVSATLSEAESSNEQFVNTLLDALLIAGILPIVTMVLATASFGNEVEDKTLSYLVLRPVRRSLIALPKLLAPIIVGGPVLVVSGVVATLLGGSSLGVVIVVLHSDAQAALAVGTAMLAGVIAYAAIFTWAGLMTTRALAVGLMYVFIWEGLITTFLEGVRYMSVRAYTLAILHGMDDTSFESLEDRVIEFPVAVGGTIIVTVVFFLLTIRRLRRMDVP